MKKSVAWVSDGFGRRMIYNGVSPVGAKRAAEIAIEVISLFKLSGRVYIDTMTANGNVDERLHERRYVNGILQERTIGATE